MADNTDILDTIVTVPANKLDADQYSADELDGVTESIFGSGNMAYASLQASQTNSAMDLGDSSLFQLTDPAQLNAGNTQNTPDKTHNSGEDTNSADQSLQSPRQGQNDDITNDTDRGIDNGSEFLSPNGQVNDSGFASSTIGSVSASELSSNAGAFAPAGSGLGLTNGQDGHDGKNGQDGPGHEIPDTQIPIDPVQTSETVINVALGDLDVDINLEDITQFIDTTFIELGDTISLLTQNITDITSQFEKIITNIINNDIDLAHVTNQLIPLSETLSETVTSTVTEITNVAETVTNLIGDIQDLTSSLGPEAVDTAFNLVDLAGLDVLSDTLAKLGGNVDIAQQNIGQVVEVIELVPNINLGDTATSLDQFTDIIENLDQSLADVTNAVDGAIEDVLDTIGIGENHGNMGDHVDGLVADTGNLVNDLTHGTTNGVTDIVEGVLDPVTDIVDDITASLNTVTGLGNILTNEADNTQGADSDITVDTGLDVAGHDSVDTTLEAIIDPVEDLIGDLDVDLDTNIDALNSAGTDNSNGDSDISLTPDIDLVDTDLVNADIEVELDPVEQITGDIDLELGAATDILGDTADGVVNDGAGGTGEETLLDDIGDALGDLATDIIPGLNGSENAESDLTVDTDIDLVNQNLVDTDLDSVLDPVEDIIGDIDSGVDVATDIIGDNNTDNENGDSDLTASVDGDIIGVDAVDIDIDIPLDPVEDITGDIDLDITSALDLLNSDNPENTAGNEGQAENSWTESTITDGGGLFDDLVHNTDGLGDALPDPAGTVAEGIGALDIEPEIDVGGIGGLFG